MRQLGNIVISGKIGLSKTKLLTSHQCLRRLWLEQRSPELADVSADAESAFATGNVVGEIARQVYGRGHGLFVDFDDGIGAAIETTRDLLADGGTAPIFEATLEYDGVVVRIDILDRSKRMPRIVEVKASTSVKEHHILDCAIQTWLLQQVGLPAQQTVVAHVNNAFVYQDDGQYQEIFVEEDVTELIKKQLALVPRLIEQARSTLADTTEPAINIGPHCDAPYACPFYGHCEPPQGAYPVRGLGGRRKKLFALIHDGYRDLRDVPEDALSGDSQHRIWEQTRLGEAFIGDTALQEFTTKLEYPRYYLDFETIAFAVPIWIGTRPYEALPFQWSCHIDRGHGELVHEAFLDVSGDFPMRTCAERLVDALGVDGPILVYTHYEARVINGLAERYPDLAHRLHSIRERLVDLHPVTKAHYYHPDMRGSWSIKAVLPTIAEDLNYATLGEVQDGNAAQVAYLEAIRTETSPARREQLRQELLKYCNFDTLAMVKLVEFFESC
jgi:hypothetical protein